MTEAQAKQLLADLFSRGFGVSGHHVGNGADYYRCMGCYESKPTVGHAYSIGELDDVDHKEDCALIKLHQWATS